MESYQQSRFLNANLVEGACLFLSTEFRCNKMESEPGLPQRTTQCVCFKSFLSCPGEGKKKPRNAIPVTDKNQNCVLMAMWTAREKVVLPIYIILNF